MYWLVLIIVIILISVLLRSSLVPLIGSKAIQGVYESFSNKADPKECPYKYITLEKKGSQYVLTSETKNDDQPQVPRYFDNLYEFEKFWKYFQGNSDKAFNCQNPNNFPINMDQIQARLSAGDPLSNRERYCLTELYGILKLRVKNADDRNILEYLYQTQVIDGRPLSPENLRVLKSMELNPPPPIKFSNADNQIYYGKLFDFEKHTAQQIVSDIKNYHDNLVKIVLNIYSKNFVSIQDYRELNLIQGVPLRKRLDVVRNQWSELLSENPGTSERHIAGEIQVVDILLNKADYILDDIARIFGDLTTNEYLEKHSPGNDKSVDSSVDKTIERFPGIPTRNNIFIYAKIQDLEDTISSYSLKLDKLYIDLQAQADDLQERNEHLRLSKDAMGKSKAIENKIQSVTKRLNYLVGELTKYQTFIRMRDPWAIYNLEQTPRKNTNNTEWVLQYGYNKIPGFNYEKCQKDRVESMGNPGCPVYPQSPYTPDARVDTQPKVMKIEKEGE